VRRRRTSCVVFGARLTGWRAGSKVVGA
jgi:hypothetical protein